VISFEVNGSPVEVEDDGSSLLDVLREDLNLRAAKDGCSPQGQCGCCTVWVDGAPRVACVTPVRRMAGRSVTTPEGLPEPVARRWAEAFVAHGASQCGFCTPGIVMRLAALEGRPGPLEPDDVATALLAHLCRCTGWQSILDAARSVLGEARPPDEPGTAARPGAAERAVLEGGVAQSSGAQVVLGRAGFADDDAPAGALVALTGSDGSPVVAESLAEARRRSAKIQGRRSGAALRHPVPLPDGDWALTLRTTWVEPAYLEPDASWCRPGGRPASPLANGGAFGGKVDSPLPDLARQLAEARGAAVRALWSREDVVRRGPKRPPVAVAVAADGSGTIRIGRTPGSGDLDRLAGAVAAVAPGLRVEVVPVVGPPTSADLRGAGWVEAAVVTAVLGLVTAGPGHPVEVTAPGGGRARVACPPDGPVEVDVWAGDVLDPVTLRSYCLGAVHQALGWVRSEGLAVDPEGRVLDLTIRSFGILTARDTPEVRVTIHPGTGPAVNGSDAVFAATAAAAWLTEGLVPEWPTRRRGPAGSGVADRRQNGALP
jgi:aerobic-type carbon monoxide dehydrogenase small subunit (CoxS/CutS family)